MKYFTRQVYEMFQSLDDNTADEADKLWNNACDNYISYLASIEQQLPTRVRHLQNNYYLADSTVLCMGQHNQKFIIVLRLETPPHDPSNNVLILTYNLVDGTTVKIESTAVGQGSRGQTKWLYEETELVSENPAKCVQSILFNNFELSLQLYDVEVIQLRNPNISDSV